MDKDLSLELESLKELEFQICTSIRKHLIQWIILQFLLPTVSLGTADQDRYFFEQEIISSTTLFSVMISFVRQIISY